MNLAEFSIRNQVLSVIVILLTIGGGWIAYKDMPRFEDPEFIIRTAQIIAQYPGATPLEVAEEVTEALEREIMQLQEVDSIESISPSSRSTSRSSLRRRERTSSGFGQSSVTR
jgi:multidrug efflux pump subunit AcrB